MKTPVAFFDVDGTIFRSSLLIELVETLVEEAVFPLEVAQEYLPAKVAWQNREENYQLYIDAVVKSFLTNIKGVDSDDFTRLGAAVVSKQNKRVYQYTRDLAKKLKTAGYYLVAISQSPKIILDQFCPEYGFDKVYGRIYSIDEKNRFTGRVENEDLINNKANIVKRVFANNPNFDATGSIAVGDTDGDINLLESVHLPVCFNPNQLLYNYALDKGWEIVVERKDVIYKI